MARKFIGRYLEQYYEELEPLGFYREIFPEGQLAKGWQDPVYRYHGTIIEKNPDKEHKRYGFVFNDLGAIQQAVEERRDCVLAPVQYHGVRRIDDNARRLNAVCFDWDGIEELKYLTNFFHQVRNGVFPEPTYLVFSGNGCHLYYLLTEPVRCKRADLDRLRMFKRAFTARLWTPYLTAEYKKPQYEAVTQAMRLVGGATKDGGVVRAFRVGDPITIQELSSYTDVPIDPTEKKVIKLPIARVLFPEWYEKRIVQGIPAKDGYICSRAIYDWAKATIESGAVYGHRYFCIMALAIFGVKCGVPFEEVERDAYNLMPYLSALGVDPFREVDVKAALRAYHPKNKNWSREALEKITGITIPPNRRNGRKQADHLAMARAAKEELKKRGALKNPDGRPSKKQVVIDWRTEHPYGKKADCVRETGLSRSTINRHWSSMKASDFGDFQTYADVLAYIEGLPEEVRDKWLQGHVDEIWKLYNEYVKFPDDNAVKRLEEQLRKSEQAKEEPPEEGRVVVKS